MDYFVVLIESKRWVAVNRDWVENPVLREQSKIFFSPNEQAVPDFSMPPQFYLKKECDGVYDCFVYKQFGKHTFICLVLYQDV